MVALLLLIEYISHWRMRCPSLDDPVTAKIKKILEAIFDQVRLNEGDDFNVLEDVTAFGDDSIVLDEVRVADFRIVGVSIRSALDEHLERTDPRLDYMVRSEMLLITTRAYAESDENLTVRIYNIGHLITPSADSVRSGGGVSRSGSALPTSQQLAQWVVETTAPPARWFDIDGEGGRLKIDNRMLIVRQSRRAHLAISDLLEQLTEHRSLLQQ